MKTNSSHSEKFLTDENVANFRALNEVAQSRGRTFAQMAIAWVLRKPVVTSALIGTSKVSQIEDCVAALKNSKFTADELAKIDRHAKDGDINLWAASSAGWDGRAAAVLEGVGSTTNFSSPPPQTPK